MNVKVPDYEGSLGSESGHLNLEVLGTGCSEHKIWHLAREGSGEKL